MAFTCLLGVFSGSILGSFGALSGEIDALQAVAGPLEDAGRRARQGRGCDVQRCGFLGDSRSGATEGRGR